MHSAVMPVRDPVVSKGVNLYILMSRRPIQEDLDPVRDVDLDSLSRERSSQHSVSRKSSEGDQGPEKDVILE